MSELSPEEKKFGALYQTTLTPLRRYLAAVLGSAHEAQDIAHDAYMRTYEAMHDQQVNQPRALLFTIARRLALNFQMRRASRMRPTEHAVLDREAAEAPDAAALTMSRQEHAALEVAMAHLPEGCREVLVLRMTEELSHKEIAARLGISCSMVEKHLARALRLLREAMTETPRRVASREI